MNKTVKNLDFRNTKNGCYKVHPHTSKNMTLKCQIIATVPELNTVTPVIPRLKGNLCPFAVYYFMQSGHFSQCPAFLSQTAKERDKKYSVKSP